MDFYLPSAIRRRVFHGRRAFCEREVWRDATAGMGGGTRDHVDCRVGVGVLLLLSAVGSLVSCWPILTSSAIEASGVPDIVLKGIYPLHVNHALLPGLSCGDAYP